MECPTVWTFQFPDIHNVDQKRGCVWDQIEPGFGLQLENTFGTVRMFRPITRIQNQGKQMEGVNLLVSMYYAHFALRVIKAQIIFHSLFYVRIQKVVYDFLNSDPASKISTF